MEEAIKVSILIPAYNVEQYIDKCLDSVMNQTLREIEIIVVDDASTDGTLAHIKAAAEKDQRIRIVRHETNLGTHKARKDAVLVSRGEYISFVDADDWLELNTYELAYAKAKEADVDVLNFGGFLENYSSLPKKTLEKVEKNLAPYMGSTLEEPLVTARFVEEKFYVYLVNKLFRGYITRNAFEKMADEYLVFGEDAYQIFCLLLQCRSYLGIEDRFYHYCYGRGSSGHLCLTLERFLAQNGRERVCRAIDRYVRELEAKEPENEEEAVLIRAAREAADAVRQQFLNMLMGYWLNRVRKKDKEKAFLAMEETWRDEAPILTAQLAAKAWEKRKEVAEALNGADFLRFEPRPVRTVAFYYKRVRNGGIERGLSILTRQLAEQKDELGEYRYRVVLITDEAPNEEDYPISPLVIREQLPSYLDCTKEAYAPRAEALVRIMHTYEIDAVLYSQRLSACLLWDLLTIKRSGRNPAFVVRTHNWCAKQYMDRNDGVEERRRVFGLADAVIVYSEADRLYWSAINPNTYIIPNVCFIGASQTRRSSYGKQVLWLGRLETQKQPMEIIRIMREAVALDPEIICHVIGDYDAALREELENAIAEAGLSDHILMEGFQLNVAPYYESSSLFLSTSQYEGWMQTIYEAAAFGMPTVTYELPYLPYFSSMKGWVSVPQLDASAAADAIVRIVNDPVEWQERSDALYQSALAYEKVDVTRYWISLLKDFEQGRKPEPPTFGEEQILLDQISYFHGVFARRTLSDRRKQKTISEQLELSLQAAQKTAEQTGLEKEALKKKLRAAKKKTKQSEEKNAALETELQTTRERAEKAEQAVRETEEELRAAKKKTKQSEEKKAALETELQTTRERAEKAEQAVKETEAELRAAQERAAKAEQDKKAYQEELKAARAREKKAEQRVSDIESSRAYRLARMLSKP